MTAPGDRLPSDVGAFDVTFRDACRRTALAQEWKFRFLSDVVSYEVWLSTELTCTLAAQAGFGVSDPLDYWPNPQYRTFDVALLQGTMPGETVLAWAEVKLLWNNKNFLTTLTGRDDSWSPSDALRPSVARDIEKLKKKKEPGYVVVVLNRLYYQDRSRWPEMREWTLEEMERRLDQLAGSENLKPLDRLVIISDSVSVSGTLQDRTVKIFLFRVTDGSVGGAETVTDTHTDTGPDHPSYDCSEVMGQDAE